MNNSQVTLIASINVPPIIPIPLTVRVLLGSSRNASLIWFGEGSKYLESGCGSGIS
jgi:hypothetical protein